MTAEQTTDDKPRIRPMKSEDVAAILELDHRVSGIERAFTYDDLTNASLGGDLDLSFISEVRGQVIGFILTQHTYVGDPVIEAIDVSFIQTIGVDPAYRRQGIATKLVDSLIERCQSKGLKMVRVIVNERDKQLQGFFQQLDFRRGELIDYTKNL